MARVKSQHEIEQGLRHHPVVLEGRRRVAEDVVSNARWLAYPHKRTGNYLRGLMVTEGPAGPKASATVPYSMYVEGGHRALNAPAGTAFQFVSKGQVYTVKKIKAQKAQLIMERAGAFVGSKPGMKWHRYRPWRHTA